jgi:Cu-processing system permease protein
LAARRNGVGVIVEVAPGEKARPIHTLRRPNIEVTDFEMEYAAMKVIWTLAQKELRDALRNRWFLLYTLAFIGLALALSYMSLAGAGIAGFAGFGRTAASLINLVLLIIPLMALTIGAQSLAHEQEQGTLAYLLAQPVTRVEVFVGKYLGLALSLLASLALGFGIAGVVLALNGRRLARSLRQPGVLQTFLLSLTMLSVGFLISALTKRAGVAIGIGLFLWLAFVFLGDLGLMGTAITLRLPIEQLLWLSLAQPAAGLQDGGDPRHQRHARSAGAGGHLRHAGVRRAVARRLPGI